MRCITKSILLLITLTLIQLKPALSQEYFSYYKGEKRYYDIAMDQVIVCSKSKTSSSIIAFKNSRINEATHLFDDRVFLTKLNKQVQHDELTEILKSFKNDESIDYASPVLISKKGQLIGGLNNQIVVKLKENTSESEFLNFMRKSAGKVKKRYEYDSETYTISLDKNSEHNALTLANHFYESNLFKFAEPDFLLFVKSSTNDPLFGQQWSLTNTSVKTAWNMTGGGASCVRIAILDNGVELNHPDFINNLDPGFDATGGTGTGNPASTEWHGTSVAGIAAAEGNNSTGIAGVAYNSRIVPVRVYRNSGSQTLLTTAGWMASGIDWSWQSNRADILNMSFGIQVGMSIIDAAINRAVLLGRNGNGCVLVAASGNESSSTVNYPASNLQVIAVGATTNSNTRASFSNYGTNIELVAPGVDIYTTDRQGANGYNEITSPNDYTAFFSGTSAASPIVSGIVALMFAVDPNMLGIRARQILQQTAQKLGGYSFTPTGGNLTWNNEVGFGLVDAKSALDEVFSFSGSSVLCTTNEDYTITNFPTGTTATWSVSPTNLFTVDSGSGTTFTTSATSSSSNGQGIITATITSCGQSATVTKTVWVGKPTVIPDNGNSQISLVPNTSKGDSPWPCIYLPSGSNTYYWEVDPDEKYRVEGETIWVWQSGMYSASGSYTPSGSGMYMNLNGPINQYSNGYSVVAAENTCGSVNVGSMGWGGCGSYYYSISPNPTTDELTISFIKSNGNASEKSNVSGTLPEQTNVPVKVEIYDHTLMRRISAKAQVSDGNIKINTSSLKPGSYVVHVQINGEVDKKHLIIE